MHAIKNKTFILSGNLAKDDCAAASNENLNLVILEEISENEFSKNLLDILCQNKSIETIILNNCSPQLISQLCQSLNRNNRNGRVNIEINNPNYLDIKQEILNLANASVAKSVSLKQKNWLLDIVKSDSINKSLRFTYNETHLITFKLTNGQLSNVEYGLLKENDIHLSDIPFIELVNVYLTLNKNKFSENVFNAMAANYFSGPVTDYLDYKQGHGVIISNLTMQTVEEEDSYSLGDNLFVKELFPILESEGIDHSLLQNEVWLRDMVISKGDGTQILHEKLLLHKIKDDDVIASHDPNSHMSIEFPEGVDSKLGGSTIYKVASSDRDKIIAYAEQNNVKHQISKSLVEGGNIISLEWKNKIFVIISKSLRIPTASYRYQNKLSSNENIGRLKDKFSSKNNPHNKSFYSTINELNLSIHTGHIKEARQAIEKELNISNEQAVWVSSPDFHIDLMMAVGPEVDDKKIIFLHNFSMVEKNARDEFNISQSEYAKNIADAAKMYDEKIGPILKNIKNKLEKKGLTVVEVPGLIMMKEAFELDESEETEEKYVCVANFMNGIYGKGKNGNFHITLPCSLPSLQAEFEKILKSYGVDNVYFIGNADISSDLLYLNGSLRCLSVPGSKYFGNLSSSKDFKNQMILPKERIKMNNSQMKSNMGLRIFDEKSGKEENTTSTSFRPEKR